MSGPLAIGAVSAVLRNMLDNGVIDANAALQTPVRVTAVAPDTIDLSDLQREPQLNLFLYQVTPNSGWRNQALPSRNGSGERLTNPPLALDLHYLLTAYARDDFHAEVLLGYAMQVLHERPMLDRRAIRLTLDLGLPASAGLPALYGALAASDLAEQVEAIKITPAMMGGDEMSKLWTAIKSSYRPSFGYLVSVVLIEAKQPTLNAMPVLSRGGLPDPVTGRDPGVKVNPDLLPPFPTLFKALPPPGQIAARLGETITLQGARLSSTTAVVASLAHRLLVTPLELPVTVATDAKASFQLPNDAAAEAIYPAGFWQVSLRVTPPGTLPLVERETNAVGLTIAPEPVVPPLSADPIEVRMNVRPKVRVQQRAELSIGAATAIATGRTDAAEPLIFMFSPSLPVGSGQKLRLRVDGVDSRLVDRTEGQPPAFDPTQVLDIS
jgi:hypothetical protein